MKTFKLSILAALISAPLAAEETIDKTWELGIFGDYVKSSTAKETDAEWSQMEAGKSLGIDLVKEINNYWSMRLEAARTRYDINDGTDKAYGYRYGIDAIYNLEDSDAYLFTGVKRFNNAKSYNAVNVGAGYNFEISERSSLYTEAAIYRDVNYGYTDQGFKLGYKYAFGEVRKAPISINEEPSPVVVNNVVAPVIVQEDTDKDNDGIPNIDDRCMDTPSGVKVDSRGCTLYDEESVSIKLNVKFANNSAELNKAEMLDIQRLADFMKEYEDTNVVIEGHSSAVGNADYNLMLSQKRADAVKMALVDEYDIDANRLTAKGFGEERLLSEGNTAKDHLINRRVVAQIEKTVKTPVEAK